jgi:hypothetical protein
MTVEKYLPPKELAAALEHQHGLAISPDYVRAVRREASRRGHRLFVAGMGRPAEVFAWLQDNPTFRVKPRSNAGCAAA